MRSNGTIGNDLPSQPSMLMVQDTKMVKEVESDDDDDDDMSFKI